MIRRPKTPEKLHMASGVIPQDLLDLLDAVPEAITDRISLDEDAIFHEAGIASDMSLSDVAKEVGAFARTKRRSRELGEGVRAN